VNRATRPLLTIATMVSISSTLRILIMWIFVPMRTEHESREITRNINVKTWISGDLLVSVMIFCIGCIFGEAMAHQHQGDRETEQSSESV
jgi:uncharacterized membrane protein